MIGKLFRRRKKVVFVYADRYRYSGSTIMRGEQLLTIFKRHFGHQYKLLYRPISTNFDNCIIFLTKGAVTDITVDQIAELTGRGNCVMLDPVDNPLDPTKAHTASCIIAASRAAYEAYRKQGLKTFLVNHHVDIRISRTPPKHHELKFGYFGELVNTIMTDEIAKRVHFVHVDTGKQSNGWLDKPPLYNLHYAVRANNVESETYKPFLKGFTAAACHANIVIQKDQKEAIMWLGEDYPYLLNPNPTEEDIVAMLDRIEESYQTTEWESALERMEAIRQQTSDETIAHELNNAIMASQGNL